MLEKLARRLGWRTLYHVSWMMQVPNGVKHGDLILIIKPWLTFDNFKAIRRHIGNDIGQSDTSEIIICSVTRL